MKTIQSLSVLLGFTLVLWSCSSTPAPLNPSTPSLSFPINEETCLEGTSINDSQSSLEFRWNAAQNAESYRLDIKNLSTNQKESFNTSGTSYSATLLTGTPYSWNITADGEEGSEPASSVSWKFYLAGTGITNYTPFPSELLAPRSGSSVTPIDGNITLTWNGSDVDGDLDYYELYLDTADATTLLQQVNAEGPTTALIVAVENSTTYSWKVIAVDADGNKSNSGVYSFLTN
ncbi:MAG: hypothetical protein HON57_02525 [Flavobacteriaceae bacterium]|nr:hypothetical protein [Candidatus Arcticimaribacter sp.]